MAKRLSIGHVLIVRRHNYIPTYFSSDEFQLQENKENAEFQLEAAGLSDSERCYVSQCSPATRDSDSKALNDKIHGPLTFPMTTTPAFPMESKTCTARFLCSGLAKRFSCNVSKMTHRVRTKLTCDGYYGCPEESVFEKKNGKQDSTDHTGFVYVVRKKFKK